MAATKIEITSFRNRIPHVLNLCVFGQFLQHTCDGKKAYSGFRPALHREEKRHMITKKATLSWD
jgi:hypothetical protein